jgi:hypothetical protein
VIAAYWGQNIRDPASRASAVVQLDNRRIPSRVIADRGRSLRVDPDILTERDRKE